MDEPSPTVSIALCTYNGERYVAEQVLSILEQSRPADQLVVSDDGSTDQTVAVVETVIDEYRTRHPDRTPVLRLLRAERPGGVAANFARALAACDGDLIALSDQDDVWHPDRLARLVTRFDEMADATLLHSDARLIDGSGGDLGVTLFEALGIGRRERGQIESGREFDALLRRNLVTGATTILRSDVRDRALPIPPGWIHDEWLAIVAAASGRTAMLDAVLTDYRQHGNNQIGARKATWGDMLSRLREPRSARNARLLERAHSLADRLSQLDGVADADLRAARAKLAHEERRSALPAHRIARVPSALVAAARGDYSRFGNGAQDVLRDLVQPV